MLKDLLTEKEARELLERIMIEQPEGTCIVYDRAINTLKQSGICKSPLAEAREKTDGYINIFINKTTHINVDHLKAFIQSEREIADKKDMI
jgi:uncharacterized protein YutE (UPF0331/DUF86 family)